MADPAAGEVYFVDLGMVGKARNVLIVSVRDPKAPLAIVTGLSLTTKYHESRYEVVLPRVPWLREQSYVNAQSLSGYKFVELGRLAGRFEASIMGQVQQAIGYWLGNRT